MYNRHAKYHRLAVSLVDFVKISQAHGYVGMLTDLEFFLQKQYSVLLTLELCSLQELFSMA